MVINKYLRGGIIGGLIGAGSSFLSTIVSPMDPTGGLSLLIWLFVQVPAQGLLLSLGIKTYESTSKYVVLAEVTIIWFLVGFFIGAMIMKLLNKNTKLL